MASAVALAALLPSCKEKETEKEYLEGSLKVSHNMPSYVTPGESYTFSPSGISVPDGTAVGYCFISPVTGAKDTLRNGASTFVYHVPDTLGTFTLTCSAFAIESSDKYYSTSGSVSFAIVSDDPVKGSIRNIGPHSEDGTVTIEGRKYNYSHAGGRDWLRYNLGTVKRDGAGNEVFGHSYLGSSAMQYIFGAYYTWEEAQTACPEGWHLPSEAEWVELLKFAGAPDSLQPLETSPFGAGNLMAKAKFNGEVMWDFYRGVDIKDMALSAIPAGYANSSDGRYEFFGYSEYAVFWTSDERQDKGVYRYIYEQYDNVFVGTADKRSFAAHVRCVR